MNAAVLAVLAAPFAAPCQNPAAIQYAEFSSSKYPNIRAHYTEAREKGYPRTLTIRRAGATERRAKLMRELADTFPTRPGYDRDEYPPAMARRTWEADLAYVPSTENRSHGASLGGQLRKWCNGVRFRYRFTP